MKTLIFITLLAIGMVTLGSYCESRKDPYEIGSHWDYSIECENGFVYKVLGDRRGAIPILNSDGSPLKCGEKIH